jgi:UDP-glucose 4-epimerase
MTRPALVVGCGLVGSHVAAALAERGVPLVCADADAGRARTVAETVGGVACALDAGRWADVASVVEAYTPRLVVDAAGRMRFPDGPPAAELIGAAARAAYTVAAASAAAGVERVVLVSSLGVYGAGAVGDVDERTPVAPATPYAAAKAAAEAAAGAATAGTPTDVVIARLAGVVGGVPTREGGRLNAALFRLFAAHTAGRPLHVDASLGGREYLDARDAAAGVIAAAERGVDGAVYNIGTGHPLTAKDVGEAFRDIGANVTVADDDAAPSWWLDVRRAADELGFRAELTLSDALRRWAAHAAPHHAAPRHAATNHAAPQGRSS